MNIEIANRLVHLRKSNGLSQEALAEKLGISRQAVSKWERAEASPDTDNLILLARLYKVSLDELLQTEDEIPVPGKEEAGSRSTEETESCSGTVDGKTAGGKTEPDLGGNVVSLEKTQDGFEKRSSSDYMEQEQTKEGKQENDEYVQVGVKGIHVRDRDGSEVHVGWDGIHVGDQKRGDNVQIDRGGVYVNGKKYDRKELISCHQLPITFFIVILYLLAGVFGGAWHPAWLLFLMIPLWHSFVEAVKHRNPFIFAYPVLTVLLFLCIGIFWGAWHPGWIIFLTIPVYYPLVSFLTGREADE